MQRKPERGKAARRNTTTRDKNTSTTQNYEGIAKKGSERKKEKGCRKRQQNFDSERGIREALNWRRGAGRGTKEK